jgi:major vault protein
MRKGITDFMCFASCDTATSTLANLETNASISRGTSYTKPRTITLDNKFEGVVSIDVWTGYAVNVISKNGDRKVVCGPQTILLDYDQTLEVLEMSTGKPKTADYPIRTVFLRHENNKVSDIIDIETKDFVRAEVKVSYCVDFDKDYMDKWFNIENYVKYLCDRERALIKREAKKYTIEEFYQNYSDIVHDVAINNIQSPNVEDRERSPHDGHRFFKENGMYVHDCEVLSIKVENSIANLLEKQQYEMVSKALELANADRRIEVAKALAKADKEAIDLKHSARLYEISLKAESDQFAFDAKAEITRREEAEAQARVEAKRDMQVVLDAIQAAELAREKEKTDARLALDKEYAELENAKQKAYAETVKTIMESISDDLVAALTTSSKDAATAKIAESLAPYAIAGRNESVSDVVNKILRGTTLEDTLKGIHDLNN